MKYRIIENCGTPHSLQTNLGLDYSYEHDTDYCSIKAAKKTLAEYGYLTEDRIRVMRHYGDAFFTFRIIQKA